MSQSSATSQGEWYPSQTPGYIVFRALSTGRYTDVPGRSQPSQVQRSSSEIGTPGDRDSPSYNQPRSSPSVQETLTGGRFPPIPTQQQRTGGGSVNPQNPVGFNRLASPNPGGGRAYPQDWTQLPSTPVGGHPRPMTGQSSEGSEPAGSPTPRPAQSSRATLASYGGFLNPAQQARANRDGISLRELSDWAETASRLARAAQGRRTGGGSR